jgi:hypothetical protein
MGRGKRPDGYTGPSDTPLGVPVLEREGNHVPCVDGIRRAYGGHTEGIQRTYGGQTCIWGQWGLTRFTS